MTMCFMSPEAKTEIMYDHSWQILAYVAAALGMSCKETSLKIYDKRNVQRVEPISAKLQGWKTVKF